MPRKTRTKHLVFQRGEYRFEIDAFTPETLPMARLAEYMAEFALMLGQPEHVHFVRLQKGSTAVVANVEWEAIPKVRERIRAVRSQNPDAPLEAVRAFHRIDNRLAEDNATGALVEPTGKTVIRFAGNGGWRPDRDWRRKGPSARSSGRSRSDP